MARQPGDEGSGDHFGPDERLERFIAGELTPVERAELMREAEHDESLALALSAVTPLSDVEIDRGVRKVQDAYSSTRRVPLRSRQWLPSILSAAVMSAAVAVALTSWPVGPPLPDYLPPSMAHDVLTGAAPWVSSEGQLQRSNLFYLTPMDATSRTPRVLVHLDDWSLKNRLDVKPTAHPRGAISVAGSFGLERGQIPPGTHTLLVAVGPEWAWAPLFGKPGSDWQTFEVTVPSP